MLQNEVLRYGLNKSQTNLSSNIGRPLGDQLYSSIFRNVLHIVTVGLGVA